MPDSNFTLKTEYAVNIRRIGLLSRLFRRDVLLEKHSRVACRCSYCRRHEHSGTGSFGVWKPIDLNRNAWMVLYAVGSTWCHYLRWTRGRSL